MTPAPLTAAELAALEAECAPREVPPCPVCKAERILIAGTYYRCPNTPEEYGGMHPGNAHFTFGQWQAPRTDPRILRLIAEVRARREETL